MKPIAYKTLYEYAFKKAPDKEQVITDFFTAKLTTDNYQGMSVLRTYDKCRIRLRDKVKDFGIITEIFKYDGDVILKNTKNQTMSLFEVEKKDVISYMFTTSDNEYVHFGETFYKIRKYVTYDNGSYYVEKSVNKSKPFIEEQIMMKYYFKFKKNAEIYKKELNSKL